MAAQAATGAGEGAGVRSVAGQEVRLKLSKKVTLVNDVSHIRMVWVYNIVRPAPKYGG
jgi:hypothetical protein